ncbi:MAG: sensor histidine kinase [Lachnospiraceae bacterium]|nr:sensor histidine kinase [Lachnospiraceae bacterium]
MSDKQRSDIQYPIKQKLLTLVLVALIPLVIITVYLIFSLLNYSRSYEEIVSNMTVANKYNILFKEDMDESLYKLTVGYVTFDTIDEDDSLKNPYTTINEMRTDLSRLLDETDGSSRDWLMSLLRNLQTLEMKTDTIKENLEAGDRYDENMQMLDNDIYILTDLIEEDIQHFIYYQTKDIENLQNQLHERVYRFIVFWGVVSAVIVLMTFVMAIFMVKDITKPIKELCDVTDKIASGDFESRAHISTDDEIMILANSVNDMSEHLEVMVDTIKEDEAKMRNAELRLLQEQINPHFLYNTLDTIVWLIESNKSQEAIDVVMSLSEFFRLVLSHGRELITIREEEQHIRSYLDIQKVRYKDILEYEIDIDKDIYEYIILKMTLQPIVENSLYHGIKYKRAKGVIRVSGNKYDDRIILKVEDDGVGMDEDTLNKLREEMTTPCKDTKTGFGLANVNERIKMHFGPDFGMEIDSQKDKGTVITITIPAIQKEATEEKADA